MNPLTGRFWTADSYEGSQRDPMSLHRYLYANTNPIYGIDPTGQFTMVEVLAATALIASAISAYYSFKTYRAAQDAVDDFEPFPIEGGSRDDQAKVKEALQLVLATKRGAEMEREVRNRRRPYRHVKITIDPNFPNPGESDHSTTRLSRPYGTWITINPNYTKPGHPKYSEKHIETTAGIIAWTITREIAHEFGHAIFDDVDPTPGSGFQPGPNTQNNENPIMYELGEPLRLRYASPR